MMISTKNFYNRNTVKKKCFVDETWEASKFRILKKKFKWLAHIDSNTCVSVTFEKKSRFDKQKQK